MLASGRPTEIPFKNYFAYANLVANMGQTTLCNVASQSIDRLWGSARLQTYKDGNVDPLPVDTTKDRGLSIIKSTPSYFTMAIPARMISSKSTIHSTQIGR
jgi:hypothetical protein